MAETINVRPSQTPKWPDCPRRGAANAYSEYIKSLGYVLRQVPTHVGAVVGTAVHAGGARLLKTKLETGASAETKAGQEAGQASLLEQLETVEISWDQTTANRDAAQRQIDRMVTTYRRDIADKVTPVAVEQGFEGSVNGRIHLAGRPDSFAIFPGALRDTKTGKGRAWNLPQYGCYSALGRAHHFEIDICIEDFLQRVSPKAEQPPVVSFEFDRSHAEQAAFAVIGQIESQMTAFEATQDPWSFPANPSSMLCSDRFCTAWGTQWCREWMPK